ncbi:MAG: hypothetical protein NVS3B27_02870 [Novosphingobium sp.]
MGMLPRAPFSAAGGVVRSVQFDLEPGPPLVPGPQKAPVRLVSMRKQTHSAAGGLAITHNLSGGGRD